MRLILMACLILCLPITAQATPKTPTDKIVDTFMTLDSDMSNGVSQNEYLNMVITRAKQRFARMDRNHDGEVSADEYRHFWKKEQARYYRLHR